MQGMREYRGVTVQQFREEIVRRYEPAVMRGAVETWPAVIAARESPAVMCTYLASRDNGGKVDVLRTPPSARGRIFYNADKSGFNYTHERATITQVIERIVKYAALSNPPAVAAQSALLEDCLPAFVQENTLHLLDASIKPRIWLGSGVVTPAHFDESSNIACVIAGRRRFTLLPPEQIANLYIGPLDFAPTGTPISLVSFREPDFDRFPKFREAQQHMFVAELEAGDAIYIPPLWWHHVESLELLNALVNYWWHGAPGAPAKVPSAVGVLRAGVAAFGKLAPEQRAAWRAIHNHFVFERD